MYSQPEEDATGSLEKRRVVADMSGTAATATADIGWGSSTGESRDIEEGRTTEIAEIVVRRSADGAS